MGREGAPGDVDHMLEESSERTLTSREGFSLLITGLLSSCQVSPRCSAQYLALCECLVNPQGMNGFVEGVTLKDRIAQPLSEASRQKARSHRPSHRPICVDSVLW